MTQAAEDFTAGALILAQWREPRFTAACMRAQAINLLFVRELHGLMQSLLAQVNEIAVLCWRRLGLVELNSELKVVDDDGMPLLDGIAAVCASLHF